MIPFLLNPSSLGFKLRSPSLPGSPIGPAPPPSDDQPAIRSFPFSTGLSHSASHGAGVAPSLASQASALPRAPFLATTSSSGVGTEPPAAGPFSQPRSQQDSAIWGQMRSQATSPYSFRHLPESLGIGKLSSLGEANSSVQNLPESLGNLGTFSPAISAQVPSPLPPCDGDARQANEVGVTGILRPIGENVAGGEDGPNQARFTSNLRSAIGGPLMGANVSGPIKNTASQVHNPNSSYYSLLNLVSLLNQSQRNLEVGIREMRSHNLTLNARVVDANKDCLAKIAAHEQSLERVFQVVVGKVDQLESRGARMETQRASMEEGLITSLNKKTEKLEAVMSGELSQLEGLKKQVAKNKNFVKYACFGGLLILGGIFLLK